MAPAKRRKANATAPQQTISTRFIRGNGLRVVHVDGAWGGITPQGLVHLGLFSEYVEPPASVTYAAGPAGQAQEIQRTGGGSVTRELEVIAIMSPNVARAVRDWLDTRIGEVDKISEQLKSRQP